jgi:hypothetical protein
MFGVNKRTFLALMTGLLALSSSGCSILIGGTGIESPGSLYYLGYASKTQADIRDQFGEADETSTCPGGQVVESRWIRTKVSDPSLAILHWYTYGLAEIFLFPTMIFQSEKQKIHFAFVYDEAGRLLYVYDLKVSPPDQFNMAMWQLAEELYKQLKLKECGTWSVCINDYVKEARQRANCIGYPLGAKEEREFEDLLTIGEWVDSGQVLYEEGLNNIRETTTHQRFQFRQ